MSKDANAAEFPVHTDCISSSAFYYWVEIEKVNKRKRVSIY